MAGRLHLVDEDAALDGLAPAWARAGFWLPVAGTVVLGVVYAIHRPWLYWQLREDHPIEWLQFTFCLAAALMSALAAFRFARRGQRGLAVLFVLAALGTGLLAGEEISWGQRVFGLVEPGLAAANKQGELNLHNMDNTGFSADKISEFIQLLMGLGAAALSILTRPARARLRSTVWWSIAPPLFTVPSFVLMALYRAFGLITRTDISPAIVYQEWAEFCFYLSIAVTVGVCYIRAAPDRYQVVLTDPSRRQLNPDSRAGLLPLIVVGVASLVLTLVFAILTMRTGLIPGNVPDALR